MMLRLLIISFALISLFLIDFSFSKYSNEIKKIKHCLKSSNVELVDRRSPKYKDYNRNFDIRVIKCPKGFLIPANIKDIKIIVRCAKDLKLKIAIKGGGHSLEKFSFGSKHHWVIDLENIDYVDVDDENGVARVGAGITAYNLVQKLIPKNFMVPCPECLSIGISGLTLGGGYGLTCRTHGLLIQQLKQIKMVNENGNEIIADSDNNPDLYWALRGAGAQSFGVVTEFTFHLTPVPEMIVVNKIYEGFLFPLLTNKWIDWAESNPNSAVGTSLLVYSKTSEGEEVTLTIKIVRRSSNEERQIISEIRDTFPNMRDEDFHFQSFNESLSEVFSCIPRQYYKYVNYYADRKFNEEDRKTLINAGIETTCEYCRFTLYMTGGKISENEGNNAFIHNHAYYVIYPFVMVPESIGYEKSRQIGTASLEHLNRFIHDTKSLDSGYSYQNDVDCNRTDWRHRYFGVEYQRLKEIKRKYSPSNLFNCPQCI